MELFTLAITSLILGLITGGLSRVDRLRPLAVIIGLGSAFTLVVIVGDFLNYTANPTIDGLYPLIVSLVIFAISCAFSARGEEIAQNFARTR